MKAEEMREFSEHMRKFLKLCVHMLELDDLPHIVWITSPKIEDRTTFGTFSPRDMTIQVSLLERHPLDIMRTMAHELTHYKQQVDGNLTAISGRTGSKQENEANATAGIIMRKFNQLHPECFSMKSLHEQIHFKFK